ncbi:O-antigen polymerase [Fibrobacter sp. UWH4]|uniref:O-antigen polymerase n=1 Tax=Fibrobacter sp. UWH4 TaxID=1896210 RepID=UPI00091CAE97|nr:O-antigen polymerase [Fibrobacter sp. UWH4]SHL76143.1 oligosaccharide repeat unit polymerase [Fibrobacter sp. UWH4]
MSIGILCLKNLFFFAVYIFSFVAFTKCYSVISISEFSAWQAVRQGMSEDELFPAWIGIIFNFVRIIFFISFAIYLCTPTIKNRFEFLLILPPVLLTCLFSARGDWFMIILTLLYLMFFIRSFSNKRIVTIGLVSFIVFLLIFIFSSLDKFRYAYAEMTELEKLEMLFSSYFINPVINFFYWFAESPEYADGKYTFRFFWAIKSALFGNADVVPTVLPFRTYNGVQSNVYTSLNWCARDFGLWWALVVQFFLGLFYGLLYKRFMKNDTFHLATIVILCLLIDPIVNQFFDDKFFSIMSHWVQRVIFVLVLIKTCVLIESTNQKNASNL